MVDDLDLQIIRLLMRNGREPNVVIAQELGITDKTVNRRMEQLLKDGVIRIRATPDPRKIGFPILTVIGIRADLRSLNATAELIAAMSHVNFVGISAGTYDLIVLAVFRSEEQMTDSLIDEFAVIPSIHRMETYIILRVFKRTADWELPED